MGMPFSLPSLSLSIIELSVLGVQIRRCLGRAALRLQDLQITGTAAAVVAAAAGSAAAAAGPSAHCRAAGGSA